MNELQRLERDYDWKISGVATFSEGVWICTAEQAEPIHYPQSSAEGCFSVEATSFWFRHRNNVISDLLSQTAQPKQLWEVGAGTGVVAAHLSSSGYEVVAVEPDPRAARIANNKRLATTVAGTYQQLQLPSGSIPAIGCFDVLEHLDHPEDLLSDWFRTLTPGSCAVITVPALSWLWNQADELAEHRCRYSTKSLDLLFKRCGFDRVTSGYFMMSLVVPYFFFRRLPYLLGRRKELAQIEQEAVVQLRGFVGEFGNTGLLRLLSLERYLARIIALPVGTSVFGIYRKPGPS